METYINHSYDNKASAVSLLVDMSGIRHTIKWWWSGRWRSLRPWSRTFYGIQYIKCSDTYVRYGVCAMHVYTIHYILYSILLLIYTHYVKWVSANSRQNKLVLICVRCRPSNSAFFTFFAQNRSKNVTKAIFFHVAHQRHKSIRTSYIFIYGKGRNSRRVIIPSNDRCLWCRFGFAICLKWNAYLYRWPSTCFLFSLNLHSAVCVWVSTQTINEHWRNKFETHVFNYFLPFCYYFFPLILCSLIGLWYVLKLHTWDVGLNKQKKGNLLSEMRRGSCMVRLCPKRQ